MVDSKRSDRNGKLPDVRSSLNVVNPKCDDLKIHVFELALAEAEDIGRTSFGVKEINLITDARKQLLRISQDMDAFLMPTRHVVERDAWSRLYEGRAAPLDNDKIRSDAENMIVDQKKAE